MIKISVSQETGKALLAFIATKNKKAHNRALDCLGVLPDGRLAATDGKRGIAIDPSCVPASDTMTPGAYRIISTAKVPGSAKIMDIIVEKEEGLGFPPLERLIDAPSNAILCGDLWAENKRDIHIMLYRVFKIAGVAIDPDLAAALLLNVDYAVRASTDKAYFKADRFSVVICGLNIDGK